VKLLIDTHILLWWLGGDGRLPKTARALMEDPDNTLFVSAVSVWEMRLKQSLGKLELPDDFDGRLAGEGFEALPLRAADTRRLGEMEWVHRDPFDRILIAQAASNGLRLLTADEVLAGYGEMVWVCR